MRSPVQAILWEMWALHRRGWLAILATAPLCAILYRVFAETIKKNDLLGGYCVSPLILTVLAILAFTNFTESNPRKGFAGFPQRLFAMPVRTIVLVSVPMAVAVVSMVGFYVVWARWVLPPLVINWPVRWPAVLCAAGVVFYQAMIWCLSGLRITRIVALSATACGLLVLGVQPYMHPHQYDVSVERQDTAILVGLMVLAYGAAIVAVERQRRGDGAAGGAWLRELGGAITGALPPWPRTPTSPSGALFWMEWRRTGLILPAAVLLTAILILGPIMWLSGRGPEATFRAALWLAALPIPLAFFVGKGISRPDFWSLDATLPTFLTVRPVTSGQIVAAKFKSAALSTLVTWTLLVFVVPLSLWLTADVSKILDAWNATFGVVYTPFHGGAIVALTLITCMITTWSLLVGGIWLGYSGRPALFYCAAFASVALVLVVIALIAGISDNPSGEAIFWSLLPWIPWAMAAVASLKVWGAAALFWQAHRRRLMTGRFVVGYFACWIAATACFALGACFLSPKVEWVRALLLLSALSAVPLGRVGASPLSISLNRHR